MRRDPALVPLSHDHQHALALCVITDRALAANAGETSFPDEARAIVAKFDSEIAAHFEIEEAVLFPALNGLALVPELLEEHRRLRGLVDSLRRSSERADIAQFTALLQQHVRKEERMLFEDVQRLLKREELDRLGMLLARA